jgi:uncharacterized protein (DUF2267 family)
MSEIHVDEHVLLARVAARMGGGAERDARRAVFNTVGALSEGLHPRERDLLLRAMGPSYAEVLHATPYHGPFEAAELFDRIQRREHVNGGFAREHAEVVLVELGEMLPAETRAHLERELPPSVAVLLSRPEHGTPPPHERPVPAAFAHTLAAGKPGSVHPLSSAAPPGAQTHSVAEDNPHGDTKVSSAEGLTQERLEESLATGRPR